MRESELQLESVRRDESEIKGGRCKKEVNKFKGTYEGSRLESKHT
jgi:hypothetical protein